MFDYYCIVDFFIKCNASEIHKKEKVNYLNVDMLLQVQLRLNGSGTFSLCMKSMSFFPGWDTTNSIIFWFIILLPRQRPKGI